MFDIKQRDLVSMSDFLKAHEKVQDTPTFEAWAKNNKSKLRPFMREISRDPLFSHDTFDPTYKAMEVSKKPSK